MESVMNIMFWVRCCLDDLAGDQDLFVGRYRPIIVFLRILAI